MTRGRALVSLLLLAVLGGCGPVAATQVVVVVRTDLAIGAAIGAIEISGAAALDSPLSGAPLFAVCAALGEDAPRLAPPLLLGVEFKKAEVKRVAITARGYEDNACRTSSIVKQTATVASAPSETVELTLTLSRACVGVSCDLGSTCVAGSCASDERQDLPTFDPARYPDGAADPIDGGLVLDGGTP